MMWLLSRTWLLFLLLAVGRCETEDEHDMSSAFIEAAKSFLTNRDAVGGLQNVASAFVQSDVGKQISDTLTGSDKSGESGIGEILLKVGDMLANERNDQNDISWDSLMNTFSSMSGSFDKKRSTRDTDDSKEEQNFNFKNIINIGKMLLGQQENGEALLGFLPMIIDIFNNGGESTGSSKKYDHSGHSWFLPPILENLHVMWNHFSNSELGHAIWKKSGLSAFVAQMSDENGNIEYEKILGSFENPSLRRRWIKLSTNFVAEWIAHVSDPSTRQRYMTTIQFVGNSFLKSQGYPRSVMFDANKPAESISRLLNVAARKHLNMKIDSSQYVGPAIAYIQELVNLASEKGFIMSRISARELSNKLSNTINNDIVEPILRSHRAYKWAIKHPQCATQILCTLNEKNENDVPMLRTSITKVLSFPTAWIISNKININFWTLYGSLMDHSECIMKYPANCTSFHEEEIRVTTENIEHNEL
ncbi:uncharacterized protein LOC118449319 isoform X1 [Vespa mandarinia]|uniref:uncharacterized protein LOC118449319 isoform X1 n=1 Tax=Vespa mandarinia TaxID=7446 RepID=UPI00161AA978|nr:uncharacterized protein LOC118449319 isoform X1 [Vespa mandarinia]XP_035739649.1 uncharacterized protein LOC118449319 isoform X1 [Vespa mandarinia]